MTSRIYSDSRLTMPNGFHNGGRQPPYGTVYLVGAGPGDPELMTLKAVRLVQSADVLIHDRLIPPEVVGWCSQSATLIDVGKYPNHHRIDQQQINQLLVHYALQGKLVVRLKGGDPFVFGRGQEEIAYCQQFGVECLVVPGISSCIAAPSAIGIPVTTRGIARSFVVLTGQTDPEWDSQFDYSAIAQIETIVILMGLKNLAALTQSLISAGRNPLTPAATVQDATLDSQQVVRGKLGNIAQQVRASGLRSPVVTIIGEVAALGQSDEADSHGGKAEILNTIYGITAESLI